MDCSQSFEGGAGIESGQAAQQEASEVTRQQGTGSLSNLPEQEASEVTCQQGTWSLSNLPEQAQRRLSLAYLRGRAVINCRAGKGQMQTRIYSYILSSLFTVMYIISLFPTGSSLRYSFLLIITWAQLLYRGTCVFVS